MEEMRKRKTANRDSDGTTPEPESHHEQHEEEESKPTVIPQSRTEENIFDDISQLYDDISQLSDYSQNSDEDRDQNHTANRDSDGTTPAPESHHEQHQEEEEEESKLTVTPQSPTEENIADEDDDISPPYYEQYSELDRDLQLAIMASLENPIDDEDDGKAIASSPKRRKITETGESSDKIHPLSFTCEICVEPKSYLDFFHIIGCTHTYCSDCIIKYVASKLQENILQIRCPVSGCGGLLEPEHCRTILPPEVFDRWGSAICEAVIPGSEKFYCPYKDCGALFIDDDWKDEEASRTLECPNCNRLFDRWGSAICEAVIPAGSKKFCCPYKNCGAPLIDDDRKDGEANRTLKCPNCNRLFCAECYGWHWNMYRDEREDVGRRFIEHCHENKWMRCPNCRFYVRKIAGCNSMYCRCGSYFCYECGEYKCRCDK